MKKLIYLFLALFVGTYGLCAQDCAIGYCPSTIVVHHKINDLSAETKDITYNVVKIIATTLPTCWITQNLGAPNTPAAITDYGANYNGWMYQVGHKQGTVPGGPYTNVVTAMTLTATDSWTAAQDPCTLSLGAAWHVPTSTDYVNAAGVSPWSSGPKLNASVAYYNNSGTWSAWYSSGSGVIAYHVQNYGISTTQARFVWNNTSGQVFQVATMGVADSYCQLLPVRCIKLVSQ